MTNPSSAHSLKFEALLNALERRGQVTRDVVPEANRRVREKANAAALGFHGCVRARN